MKSFLIYFDFHIDKYKSNKKGGRGIDNPKGKIYKT